MVGAEDEMFAPLERILAAMAPDSGTPEWGRRVWASLLSFTGPVMGTG
jgi:hypothetical protein